jgi:hypothetical protein
MAILANGLETLETGQQDARDTLNGNFAALDQYRYRSGPRSTRPAGEADYDGQLYLTTEWEGGPVGAALEHWDGTRWVTILSTKLRTDDGVGPAMASDDSVVLLDASSVSQNVTLLPADHAARAAGVPITFKRIDNNGGNTCGINRASDRQIDGNGSGSFSLASQYDSVTLVSDGADNYRIVAQVVN